LFEHSGFGPLNECNDTINDYTVNPNLASLGFSFNYFSNFYDSVVMYNDGDIYLRGNSTVGPRISVYYLVNTYSSKHHYLFRQETDSARLGKLSLIVQTTTGIEFAASNAFIITWYAYASKYGAYNSFQLIMATNGQNSFLIFNYQTLNHIQNIPLTSAYSSPRGTVFSYFTRVKSTTYNTSGHYVFRVDSR
jgi:hypothetical protein